MSNQKQYTVKVNGSDAICPNRSGLTEDEARDYAFFLLKTGVEDVVVSLDESKTPIIASTIEVEYIGEETFVADAEDPGSLGIKAGQTVCVITKENLNAILDERSKAVAYAYTIDRADDRLAGMVDKEMQIITQLPLGKKINESISQAVARVMDERHDARKCVAFFASVIKSGESWSPACQKALNEALGKA